MRKLIKRIGKRILPRKLRIAARKPYLKLKNKIKYGSFDFFQSVEFENITSCNRRCSYCPNSIYDRGLIKNKKVIDEALFKKIIDELSGFKFSGRISPVFFGEPLLDERLTEWTAYIRKNLPNADIIIHSNGDLLTYKLYNNLIKSGVDLFVITEHGEHMAHNIKELLKNFQETNYKDDYMHDKAYAPVGQKKATILYRDLKKKNNLYNRGGLLKNMDPIKTKKLVCKLPSEILLIDYQGNIILCCNDYFSKIKFGNIKNETILDIWDKKEFKKIRNELAKGDFRLDMCKKCKVVG